MVINKNRKAIIWSGLEKVSTYLVNFTIQIILARLLCPDDYAVVAMLSLFFAISQALIDGGFATTLIQKQDCSQSDYSSVFYFNIFIGVFIYLIFFFGAKYIEAFFHYPNLGVITKVYSLSLLISSFSMVHRVILIKKLLFKRIAISSLIATIVSAIPTIFMAFLGLGYWALVAQSIISALVTTILYIIYSRWSPSLLFSVRSLRELAPFGLRMLFVYLFNAVYNNLYSLLIGKKFTTQELGYYDRGKTLGSMGPVGFSDFYIRALYPIQAKIQDDSYALELSYNKSFTLLCLAIAPVSAFMLFFSEATVFTLYGEQWLPSSWILSILSLGFFFYPLQSLNVNMLKVKGRGDLVLQSEAIKKILGILIVLVLININLKAVVFGWTLYAFVEFIISEYYCVRLHHFALSSTIASVFLIVLSAFFFSFLLSFLLNHFIDNYYLKFFLGGICFVIIYGVVNLKSIKQLIWDQ